MSRWPTWRLACGGGARRGDRRHVNHLAWKKGLGKELTPQPTLGVVLLVAAVLLRYASALAAELFTLRISLLAALVV